MSKLNKVKVFGTLVLGLTLGLSSLALHLDADQQKARVTPQKKPQVIRNKQVVVAALKPDLLVKSAAALETNVYKLKVTIRNKGMKASGACILRVEDKTNQSNIQKKDIAFAALPGTGVVSQQNASSNERTVIVTLPFTVYGNKFIVVTIDALNVINEMDEKNNTFMYDTLIK